MKLYDFIKSPAGDIRRPPNTNGGLYETGPFSIDSVHEPDFTGIRFSHEPSLRNQRKR